MMAKEVMQIDIAGDRYIQDYEKELLVSVEDENRIIAIGALDIAMDNEWERSGYYDLKNHCLYEPPDDIESFPENVVGFAIPSHAELLEARKTLLVVFAETVSLEQTDLAVTIWENQQRAKLQKEETIDAEQSLQRKKKQGKRM